MTESPLQAADNMVVTLAYDLYLDDDELIDSSEELGPLEYLHGHNQILPGLERAVTGLIVGESIEVGVPPERAYGPRVEDSLEVIPRQAFPDDLEMEVGMELELVDSETGAEMVAYISDIGPDAVMIDFNHPLAGETLFFEVKVLEIRPATAEELAHGHVHSHGEHES